MKNKNPRKPTRQQKIFIASRGLKPWNWYVEKDTDEFLWLVSKNGGHRYLKKEKKNE